MNKSEVEINYSIQLLKEHCDTENLPEETANTIRFLAVLWEHECWKKQAGA